MSKHTPGPWYANKEGYIYRRPLSELYKYGGSIAGDKPLAATWKGWYEEGETGYPVEANARLIAAAPEMFELIQQVADLQNPRNYNAAYNDLVIEQDKLADLAQELLAKIEGGGE